MLVYIVCLICLLIYFISNKPEIRIFFIAGCAFFVLFLCFLYDEVLSKKEFVYETNSVNLYLEANDEVSQFYIIDQENKKSYQVKTNKIEFVFDESLKKDVIICTFKTPYKNAWIFPKFMTIDKVEILKLKFISHKKHDIEFNKLDLKSKVPDED